MCSIRTRSTTRLAASGMAAHAADSRCSRVNQTNGPVGRFIVCQRRWPAAPFRVAAIRSPTADMTAVRYRGSAPITQTHRRGCTHRLGRHESRTLAVDGEPRALADAADLQREPVTAIAM